MTHHPDERAQWSGICHDAKWIAVAADTLGFGGQLRKLREQAGSLTEWRMLLADIEAALRAVDGHITKGDNARRRRLLARDEDGYVCPTDRCDRREPWTAVGGAPRCGLLDCAMTET